MVECIGFGSSVYCVSFLFFFFNDTATTEIYTLSLHDALPISPPGIAAGRRQAVRAGAGSAGRGARHSAVPGRSEEHTSELQSPCNLVCRLLLEKKKKNSITKSLRTIPCAAQLHLLSRLLHTTT